jgi:hypothetical protein
MRQRVARPTRVTYWETPRRASLNCRSDQTRILFFTATLVSLHVAADSIVTGRRHIITSHHPDTPSLCIFICNKYSSWLPAVVQDPQIAPQRGPHAKCLADVSLSPIEMWGKTVDPSEPGCCAAEHTVCASHWRDRTSVYSKLRRLEKTVSKSANNKGWVVNANISEEIFDSCRPVSFRRRQKHHNTLLKTVLPFRFLL